MIQWLSRPWRASIGKPGVVPSLIRHSWRAFFGQGNAPRIDRLLEELFYEPAYSGKIFRQFGYRNGPANFIEVGHFDGRSVVRQRLFRVQRLPGRPPLVCAIFLLKLA